MSLIWEDGRKFEIAHVLDVRRAASTKAGGTGFRYTVIIEGKERYIWLEDIIYNKTIGARWFIIPKSE